MRHCARLSLLLILFSGYTTAARAQDPPPPPAPAAEYNDIAWKPFVSPEGGFSVRMVGTPRLSEKEADSPLGKLPLHLYTAQGDAGGYMVAYADFPRHSESPEFVSAVLNGARDRVLSADKSKRLLSEREVKIDGHDGREWMMEDGKSLFRARTFMANGRFYQLLLVTPLNVAFNSGRADDSGMTDLYEDMSKRFFDSFKLIPFITGAGMATPKPDKPQTGDAPPVEPEPKARVMGGILNGKALNRLVPRYPAEARAAGASGEVKVKIVVDELGKVIWARAIEGHELLRAAAEDAARRTSFTPTTVEGRPERVMGFLIYRFMP
jgi:TonB family protein